MDVFDTIEKIETYDGVTVGIGTIAMTCVPSGHANMTRVTPRIEPVIEFKKLDPGAIIPARATQYSAGFDLHALRSETITGGQGVTLVRTGIAVGLPPGTYGRIAMRSGLGLREGLCVTAGVIDRDYVGEIGVLVYMPRPFDDHGMRINYDIKRGERIAQLVIECYWPGDGVEVREFTNHAGSLHNAADTHGGFGSSGKF